MNYLVARINELEARSAQAEAILRSLNYSQQSSMAARRVLQVIHVLRGQTKERDRDKR